MNKAVVFLIIAIIVILGAGLVYFAFQNQNLLKSVAIEPSLTAPTSSPAASSTAKLTSPSPATPTLQEVKEAIVAATNKKDHSGLSQYLAKGKINFIIMSSSCCEPKTPQEAIDSLNYIDEGIDYDFNQSPALISNLKTKNERLNNTYIGLSKTKENLVAYTLNSKNEVTQIEVSVSYKLYNQ